MRLVYFTLAYMSASTAIAEVCDKVRPSWDPATGPISSFDEAVVILMPPMGIILGIIFAGAIFLRKRWVYLTAAGLTFLPLVPFLNAKFNNSPGSGGTIFRSAMAEGCVGGPSLYLIGAICGAGVLLTAAIRSEA